MMALRNIPRAMLQPYTSAVDIWALGVLIHETLTGRTPFAHKDPAIMAFKAQYGSATKLPEHISQECQSFADMALQKSADKRPTAVDLLSHPWIKKHAATNMAQVVNGHVRYVVSDSCRNHSLPAQLLMTWSWCTQLRSK